MHSRGLYVQTENESSIDILMVTPEGKETWIVKVDPVKDLMAAIEIDSKNGAENQLSHGENGISRSYFEGILAYKDVIGFANVL